MTAPAAREHLGFLDGVRGIAATYVVLHHASMNVPQTTRYTDKLVRAFQGAASFGHYSVDMFIVLSGYCLMLPFVRDGALGSVAVFLQRRAWRILPPYYVSALVTLFLIATVIGQPTGTHWDTTIPVTPMDLWTHLLLVHDWFESTSLKISHVYWSIGVEWKIYFLFPILCVAWQRLGPLRTTLLAVILGYGVWLVLLRFDVLNPTPWGSSPYYVGLFAMGMLGANARELMSGAREVWLKRLTLLFWLLSALALAITVPLRHYGSPPSHSLVVGAWTTALLVTLRERGRPSVLMALCSSRLLMWLGKIGYSLYLMHAPVLQLVYVLVLVPFGIAETATGFWVMIAAGTAASILVAHLFYQFVEYPFHGLSRRVRRATVTA